jgi:Zn finger protein HypA/HybF involved in hydrogenase expression
MLHITEADFLSLSEDHAGYCTKCEDITHDCCEPDARRYECPECGNKTVYGLEELLIMGLVEFEDEDDEDDEL